jgi:hypothetical protein
VPRTRSSPETESKLPTFKVGRSKSFPNWVLVHCGYEDCPSREKDLYFLVHRLTFKQGMQFTQDSKVIARPCPYCFRVSFLPKSLR